MENPTERQLNALLDLQAVDSQLDDLTKAQGELPEEVEHLENKLQDFRVILHTTQEEITGLEQDIAAQRVNIKAVSTLVKKYEEQQMNVRNNREYDAITKEIDLQRLEVQLSEKRIKNAYERLEEKKLALEQHQGFIEKHQHGLADKQAELQVLVADSQTEAKKLQKQRMSVTKRIDAALVESYERIRSSVRNKLAVVVVKKGACGGCFNEVPPQKQADIKEKKRVIVCEHCGRIIADVETLPEAY